MKKLFLALLVASLCSVAGQAQDFVPWANKFFAPEDTPPVVVQDFGTVPYGTLLKHRFKVTNIYKVPIQIAERPIVSCGCVEPISWPQVLQPKEEGFLDITMDAKKFTGAKSVTIQVKFISGKDYRSTAILQARAFGRADVMLTPGSLDFGQVATGQKVSRTLDVNYTGQSKWEVVSGEANDKILDVKIEALSTRDKKPAYRVTASLKDGVPAGAIQEQIVLKTNDATSPFVTLNVTANVLAPYEVSPKLVKFDELEVGSTGSRRVIISGNKLFRIESVEGQGDGLTAKFQASPNKMQFLEVNFQPTAAGEVKKELKLKTDTNEIITVPVEASAKAK